MRTRGPALRCSRTEVRGFTLIEVMITVAIIGILAAIAYPSYLDYIRRGKRATAQTALTDLAARQQAYLLDRRGYAAALADVGFSVPKEIATDYAFSVAVDNAAAPPTFVATAKPVSAAQSANGELDLTLNQSGVKTPTAYWSK